MSAEPGVFTGKEKLRELIGLELEGIGGRYLEDCQEAAPYDPSRESAEMPFHGYLPYALDTEQAERLWTLSQDLVGLIS